MSHVGNLCQQTEIHVNRAVMKPNLVNLIHAISFLKYGCGWNVSIGDSQPSIPLFLTFEDLYNYK